MSEQEFELYPQPGHNGPPKDVTVQQQIDDLYEEAKHFADGEPIADQEMHDAMEELYNGLHEAGKEADELRKEEKAPHDKAVKAVQDKWNPFVQPKKGKVDRGKAALGELLAAWRQKVQAEKAAEAEKAAAEAARLEAEAQAAIRSSAGYLDAREQAEAKLKDSKDAAKFAKRTNKAATTGTGLRTVPVAEMTDKSKALDWAFERDEAAFLELVQGMANAAVRSGARELPGFEVTEKKVAQ